MSETAKQASPADASRSDKVVYDELTPLQDRFLDKYVDISLRWQYINIWQWITILTWIAPSLVFWRETRHA